MTEANAVMALKNAWQGAVSASEQVSAMRDAVMGISDHATLADLDLDGYHHVTATQSMAVMALRGLIEELRRKRDAGMQV